MKIKKEIKKEINNRYNEPVFGDVFDETDVKIQITDFELGLSTLKDEFNKQYLNFYISRKTKMKYYSNENNELVFTINKDDISSDKIAIIDRMQVLLTQSPRNYSIKAGDNTSRGHNDFNCIEFNSGIKSSSNSIFGILDTQFKSKGLNTLNNKIEKEIFRKISSDHTFVSFEISEYSSLEHEKLYKLKKKEDKKIARSSYGV